MGRYIWLIMYEYYELIKNNTELNNDREWKNVLKENWLVIVLLGIVLIFWGAAIVLAFYKPFIKCLICFGLGTIFLLISLKVSEIMEQKRYIKNRIKYSTKVNILRHILIEQGFYEKNKIEYLIQQCSELTQKYKFSNKISQSVKKLTKTVFLPILTFAIGIASNNNEYELKDIALYAGIAMVIVLLLLLFAFEIKVILESILDSRSEKLNTLKDLLNDIDVKDFV